MGPRLNVHLHLLYRVSKHSIFIYHKFYRDSKYVLSEMPFTPWLLGGLAYTFGAFCFALRVPEKYFPVKFDIIGNSHNIHHVMVVMGAANHLIESVNVF